MAKVILITSREIKSGQAIKLKFEQYDENDPNWANGYLVQFSKHWVNNISLIQNEEKSKIIEDIQSDGMTEEKAKKISEDIVKKIRTRYKTSSNPFKLGIFYTQRGDTHVYCAEEYPFGSNNEFGEGEQRYLNSLFAEIGNHLNVDSDKCEWHIYSHDKDWGVSKNNSVLDNKGTIGKVTEGFDSLIKVLGNSNTTIRIFQHITSDDTYLYVKYLIENDSLMPSFEDFIKQGECQKQIFKDYMQNPNNENWKKLMGIDTNYPFMPFDIAENPLSQKSDD